MRILPAGTTSSTAFSRAILNERKCGSDVPVAITQKSVTGDFSPRKKTLMSLAFFSSNAATQRRTSPIPALGVSFSALIFFALAGFFFAGETAAFFAEVARLTVVPARLFVVFVVFDLAGADAFFGVVFRVVGMVFLINFLFPNDSQNRARQAIMDFVKCSA